MDPQSALVCSTVPEDNIGNELRWSAGPLIGSVDWACEQLLGISPLVELTRPLVGDFGKLQQAIVAWRCSEAAVVAIGTNVAAAGQQSTTSWRGPAGDAFRARMEAIAKSCDQYGEGCSAMAQVSEAMLDLCKTGAQFLLSVLGWLGDWATRIVIQAAVPVFGWIAGAIDGAINTAVAIDKVRKGLDLIQKVIQFIERFRDVILVLAKVAAAIKVLADVATAVTRVQIVHAGSDASATSFGAA